MSHVLQMINIAARLVTAHLEFCTSGGHRDNDFCCFTNVTYMSRLHWVIRKCFTLIFAVYNHKWCNCNDGESTIAKIHNCKLSLKFTLGLRL